MLKIFERPSFTYVAEMAANGKLKSAKAHLDIKGDDVATLDNAISTLIRLKCEMLERIEAENIQQ